MKESFKMTIVCMLVLISYIWVMYYVITKSDVVSNTPDTTIKKYIDKEANMMCYYTDAWGSCFYVLED